VRYKEAIETALRQKINNLKKSNPFNIDIDLLEKVETAIVMSGGNNDEPHLKAFTDSTKHKAIMIASNLDITRQVIVDLGQLVL
jgi:type I restriction enzyme R subunit